MDQLKTKIRHVPDSRKRAFFSTTSTLLQDQLASGWRSTLSRRRSRARASSSWSVSNAGSSSARLCRPWRRVYPCPQAGQAAVKTTKATYDLEYGSDSLGSADDAVRDV
jgi:hypothetical protein